MVHRFIGGGLLIVKNGVRVLAIADLHLGYDQAIRECGVFVPGRGVFEQTMDDLKELFNKLGRVDYVVLLGDVKHVFGTILPDERKEILSLFDYLLERSRGVVVIKGNHDVALEQVTRARDIEIMDYWVWEGYCFLHGDRDFDVLYRTEIKTWVVGHAHPAIELSDGIKHERYKCFLCGSFKNKEIIVMPSLFLKSVGIDVLTQGLGLAWPIDVMRCYVYIVNGGETPLNFGTGQNIKSRSS